MGEGRSKKKLFKVIKNDQKHLEITNEIILHIDKWMDKICVVEHE